MPPRLKLAFLYKRTTIGERRGGSDHVLLFIFLSTFTMSFQYIPTFSLLLFRSFRTLCACCESSRSRAATSSSQESQGTVAKAWSENCPSQFCPSRQFDVYARLFVSTNCKCITVKFVHSSSSLVTTSSTNVQVRLAAFIYDMKLSILDDNDITNEPSWRRILRSVVR